MISNEFLLECEQYIKNGGILYGAVYMPVVIPTHEAVDTKAAAEFLNDNRGLIFSQQLFYLIDKRGLKDSEVYKKAWVDRRIFSKIRGYKEYTPVKKTVIALCMALELSREEADLLLSSAGYSLSRADDFDLTIAFCIEKKVYNFFEINEVLYHFGFEVF